MAVRLTNPMTGTSKLLGENDDEETYRMLGWHDTIPTPTNDGEWTPEPDSSGAAPAPESVPDANQGDLPEKPKPKKSAEAPPPENQEG